MRPLDRIAWLGNIAGAGLAPRSLQVACALAQFIRIDSGEARPCRATIARITNLKASSIKRALKDLEEAGFLEVDRTQGRGRCNICRAVKGSSPEPLNEVKGSNPEPFSTTVKGSSPEPFNQIKGFSPDHKRVQPCSEKGSALNPEQGLEQGLEQGNKKTPPRVSVENPVAHARASDEMIEQDAEDPFGPNSHQVQPEAIYNHASPTIPPRLREVWSEIAQLDGSEIAERAIEAARRIFRSPTEAQVRQTYQTAHQANVLSQPANEWPDFRERIRGERLAQRSQTTATATNEYDGIW